VGAGSKLKARLESLGIRSSGGCSCGSVAKQMDTQGPAWCRANSAMILEQMRVNARNRHLPFSLVAAGRLLMAAIEEEESLLARIAADRTKVFSQRVADAVDDISGPPQERDTAWALRPETIEAHRQVLSRNLAAIVEPATHGDGRGIVILGGSIKYFPSAYVLIHMLRRLGCTLPVECWYFARHEFDHAMQAAIEKLGVRCVDASEVLTDPKPRALGGHEAKPWAIAGSAFAEVLYLDADIVPVVDPSYLFESAEYQSEGVVAWPANDSAKPVARVALEVLGLSGVDADRPWDSGALIIDKRRAWRAIEADKVLADHSEFFRFGGVSSTLSLASLVASQAVAIAPACVAFGDKNSGGLNQHDFAGNIVWQHRQLPSSRIRLSGPVSGQAIINGELFTESIAAIKAAWRPAIWEWIGQTAEDNEAAALAVGPYFATGIPTEDARIELLSGGTIKGGRSHRWRIAREAGQPRLVIADAGQAVAFLSQADGGEWVDRHGGARLQPTAPSWWQGIDCAASAELWTNVAARNVYGLPGSLEGQLVLDIGAGEGIFAHEAFRRGAAYVVSVEPDGESFARLSRNLEARGESIRINAAAWRSDEPSRWVSIDEETGDLAEASRSFVRTMGLDDLIGVALEASGRKRIDLLRIGCGGASWPILLPASRLASVAAICGTVDASRLWACPEWYRVPRTTEGAVAAMRAALSSAGLTHTIDMTSGRLTAWRGERPFLS